MHQIYNFYIFKKQTKKTKVTGYSKSGSGDEDLGLSPLAAWRFGHDEHLDGLAEGDGSFHSRLWRRETVVAVTPSQL